MKYFLIFILSTTLCLKGDGQLIYTSQPASDVIRDCNIIYTHPLGWEALDSTFNDKPLVRNFLYKYVTRSGIYNPTKDIYMILGSQLMRIWPGHLLSDSAVNNFYHTPDYLSMHDLVSLQEDIVTSAMLKEANVDDVVAYRIKLDTPFLGKYHYAKQFLLHKQDVANVTLNFVALNKRKEKEIDEAFKKLWGMIRFRPDSVYKPEFRRNELVGKFRHLRPYLNKADSLIKANNQERVYFGMAMMNGNLAEHAKKYKRARKNFLRAHEISPKQAAPVIRLFSMFLQNNQLDSATHYMKMLHDIYLPHDSKLGLQIKFGLAMLYDKKGMLDSAIVVNKQLLAIQPHNLNSYDFLGDLYQKTQAYQKGITIFKKAKKVLTKYPSHKYNDGYFDYQIGFCYKELSKLEKAKEYFLKAKEEGYDLSEEIEQEYGL